MFDAMVDLLYDDEESDAAKKQAAEVAREARLANLRRRMTGR